MLKKRIPKIGCIQCKKAEHGATHNHISSTGAWLPCLQNMTPSNFGREFQFYQLGSSQSPIALNFWIA